MDPRPLIALLLALVALPAVARAETVSYEVGDHPIVQVGGRSASLDIETWSRSTVQIAWPDGAPYVASKGVRAWNTGSVPIPARPVRAEGPDGPVAATLPSEDFPVPGVLPGPHDFVRVQERSPGPNDTRFAPARVRVTIPASTALLMLVIGRGDVTLHDYRGTTILNGGGARITFLGVGGDAFVQPLGGRFYAQNSSFERLRVRSNRGDQIYEHCTAGQIDASSLSGNIIFDAGTVTGGPAHFASERGFVALGVSGGAQIGAHTDAGRVFSRLAGRAQPMPGSGPGDAGIVSAGGGPLVNAASVEGNIFLYDGSVSGRTPPSPQWRPVYEAFSRRTRPHADLQQKLPQHRHVELEGVLR